MIAELGIEYTFNDWRNLVIKSRSLQVDVGVSIKAYLLCYHVKLHDSLKREITNLSMLLMRN